MQRVKQFIIELCCVYTLISVVGAFVNIITGTETNNANVITMFLSCAIATFVLYMHILFDNVSPLVMIIVQYLAACFLCALMILGLSYFYGPVTPWGWFEYFRSFTIPYIILAALYYYRVFSEAKKQNALIQEIQQKSREKNSGEV